MPREWTYGNRLGIGAPRAAYYYFESKPFSIVAHSTMIVTPCAYCGDSQGNGKLMHSPGQACVSMGILYFCTWPIRFEGGAFLANTQRMGCQDSTNVAGRLYVFLRNANVGASPSCHWWDFLRHVTEQMRQLLARFAHTSPGRCVCTTNAGAGKLTRSKNLPHTN
jgi:hypothetical protein